MELAAELWRTLDALLIFPYRLPRDPTYGWWLGTLLLAVWSAVLGESTLALVRRVNRRYVDEHREGMLRAHRDSWTALKGGNKEAWRGFNDQANEAFGRAFFLQLAMGCASLWPAFLALAWLRLRFESVGVPLPFTEATLNYVGGFVLCYLPVRLGWAWCKKLWRNRLESGAITE